MSLTDAKARAAKPTDKRYELVDGDGLALVVLPSGSKIWRLRYRTTSGERKHVKLGKYPDVGLSSARQQAGKLRGDVYAGKDPAAERAAKREPGATLASVVESYIDEHAPGWRPKTADAYIRALRVFTRWADGARIRQASQLTPGSLAKLRGHLISLPRRAPASGGPRGEQVTQDEKRSPATVNRELRAIKTFLQASRRARRLPGIVSSDEISDALALVRADMDRPRPMKPAKLRKLLAACLEHDSTTWMETRSEHRGVTVPGSTRRYDPVGPFVATMLLTGMRLGEALALTWDDVDLDEHEIRVRASKTGRERSVDLAVSPALHRLLASMRGDGKGRVFSWTRPALDDARLRLINEFGAPAFQWSVRNSRAGERSAPTLRSTCGCYLTCAPSIFGAASVFLSAAALGHSVRVAETHYLVTLRRIPKEATTLEAAMEIEAELQSLALSHSSSSSST